MSAAQYRRETEAFAAQIRQVPWFQKLGHPISESAGVARIHSWDEWEGPQNPGVEALNLRQQAMYDELMEDGRDRCVVLTPLWESVHKTVIAAAASAVPYDPDEDCYYAPTLAVWQAAWTAGLVALYLECGQRIPPREIHEQWRWYTQGHWPCGYACVSVSGDVGPLIVY